MSIDREKAVRLIKTTTAAKRYPRHNAKPSDPYYFILEFGGNTVLNLTRVKTRYETYYENDTVSTTHKTIRDAKRMVVDMILAGDCGWMVKDRFVEEIVLRKMFKKSR